MAKILVVDDSQMVRKKLRAAFETKGHTIIEAVDGLDGIQKFTENDGIQLIVADVNMPNMHGVDMCLKIREDKRSENTKILMLTAEASQEMRLLGATAKISAWILKPYDIEKVLNAVEKLILR